jgi:hypothetical protein
MKRTMTITETLRKEIADSGMSFKALEKESGVVRQSLMKFATGERHMRGDMLDKLAEYFELELRPKKATKRKAK